MPQDAKRVVEAILFMRSEEVSVEELMKITNVAAPGFVKRLIDELQKEYDERGSAIEIRKVGDGYVMRIRKDYVPVVQSIVKQTELSQQALDILGYVVKNEGVKKSEIAKSLGSWVYNYIRELEEKKFIRSVRSGRTKRLYLTKKFHDYFK